MVVRIKSLDELKKYKNNKPADGDTIAPKPKPRTKKSIKTGVPSTKGAWIFPHPESQHANYDCDLNYICNKNIQKTK